MFLFVDGEVFSELLKGWQQNYIPQIPCPALKPSWCSLLEVKLSSVSWSPCESVLVELVPEHTAFQEAARGRLWSLKRSTNLWWTRSNSMWSGKLKMKALELVSLIICELDMKSADSQLTFLFFFFPTQNTNYKFILSSLGTVFSLAPSIKCSS